MAAIVLTLYGRPKCHLCDDMKDIVRPVARELHCELSEVDISGNPTLEARFGQEIPVLLVNGRKAFKFRVTPEDLRKRLRVEQQRPAPSSTA